MQTSNRTALAVAISAALAAAPSTQAQSGIEADERIIVYGTQSSSDNSSGSRLNLDVLATPATVDVIDGDAIRDRVDLSVTEAVTRSAGITTEANPGNGHSSFQARGFTGTNSVTRLYDGNPIYAIADVATFPEDTWSLERIEVLKGPSSVLYGQGGIGGAINLIPRRPEFESSSQIRVLMGENDTSFVGVDFTGGLTDTVAYRFDYSTENSDGWVNNGDSETENLALALLWQASDDFSLTARYDASDEKPTAYFGSLTANGDFLPQFTELNLNTADAEIRYQDESLRLKADWALGEATGLAVDLYQMDSDRFWRNAEYYEYFEAEGGVLRTDPLILDHDVEQQGARATFSIDSDASIQAVVGLEASNLSFSRRQNWGPGNPQPIDWWNFAASIAASTGDFDVVDPYAFEAGSLNDITAALATTLDNWSDMDQFAVFGEARFELSDRLALVGALRYEDFDASYTDNGGAPSQVTFDSSADATTGRLGLVYDFSEDTAVYGQYGTGAENPGGSVVTVSGSLREADMVESEQVEIGIKHAVSGTGLQWNVALFDITKNNLLIDDPDSPDPADVIVIEEQTSTGIEIGLNYAASNRLQLHANLVTLDAEDDSGETPTGVPETTWNTGLAWSATESFRLVADLRFVDDRPRGSFMMPSYTVLDASAHFRVNEQLSVILKGDNLTDELYASGSYWSGTWLVGKPRTLSIAADLQF